MKFDWDMDECAQPYDRVPQPKARKEVPASKKPTAPMTNRFQLLNFDDGEEEEDEIAAVFQSKKSVDIAA
jgi:hypothetical protein